MTNENVYTPYKHPKNTARMFKNLDDDADVARCQYGFLIDIWDNFEYFKSKAYAFLGFRRVSDGTWFEKPIKIKNGFVPWEVSEILIEYNRWDYEQYVCLNTFSKPCRKRQFACPTGFGWCDIGEGDPHAYDPWPSLVWETSPDRYQALWSWDTYHEPNEAERYSKALAYRHGGDQNSWSITKMLRLVGSVNHEPQHDEPYVHTVACDWTEIRARPLVLKRDRTRNTSPLLEIDVDPTKFDKVAVFKKYRKDLHPKVQTLIGNRKAYEPNHSAQIFHMIAALLEAGANHDEIACVIWRSPYFLEKHGHDLGKLKEEIARVVARLRPPNKAGTIRPAH